MQSSEQQKTRKMMIIVDDDGNESRRPGIELANKTANPQSFVLAEHWGAPNPAFKLSKAAGPGNTACLPNRYIERLPDGRLHAVDVFGGGRDNVRPASITLKPGESIVVDATMAHAIVQTRCNECLPPQHIACRDFTHSRTVCGGQAPSLTMVFGDEPVEMKVDENLEPRAPEPPSPDTLHARVMLRAAGKAKK
jgi:hypothetical protein